MNLTRNRVQLALIAMGGVIILTVGLAGDSFLGIVCGAVVLASLPFTWRRRRRSETPPMPGD